MTARPTSSTPFSRDEARAHDRRLIETLGFLGAVLMENAGRGCVELMESLGVTGSVLVVTGKGNNAGEGFVIARHVALRGHVCRVALGAPASELRGDALTAFTMLTPCGVPILDLAGVNPALVLQELDAFAAGSRWIVDAILGVGAVGVPRPPCDTLIDWMNGEPARRLAVDVPSGLDADTGEPASPTVRADVTATFVAPKAGFANHTVAEWLGEVRVLGIGAPSR